MRRFHCAILLATALLLLWQNHQASADVIVLANRTGARLPVQWMPAAGQVQQLVLPVGEVIPMFLDGRANVSFATPGNPKRYRLDANCAYYFGRTPDGRIELQKIGLGEDTSTIAGRSLPGSATRAPLATIPVKILADEEEPGRRVMWERRFRRRIEAASAILEKHCRVGLKVVAVDTWNSDNATNDFMASLAEFEREVKPFPARLAIGFTSQWAMTLGRTHMAGTRGPLHTHILVREGSPQISEPEKLEFLVHELGHHLGAAHSPEPGSVMRPVLGDDRAGRSTFQIQFDPVNTLLVAMVGEEIRRRNVTHFFDLTADTKRRLRQIYFELARSLPNDPAAPHYMRLTQSAATAPLAVSARQILQEISRAAVANRALPAASGNSDQTPTRREGDALTDHYVREAARAASQLAQESGPKAFLAAVGIALGDPAALASVPGTANLVQGIDSPSERVLRVNMLGEPTMRGRRDLAQHFFVSAYLTATLGATAAETAGLAKELADAHMEGGFSFADLAADRAGMRFADAVLDGRLKLPLLSRGFIVSSYMPEVDGLPEGLSSVDVAARYGSKEDPRFQKQLQQIDRRIQTLPGYRATGPTILFR